MGGARTVTYPRGEGDKGRGPSTESFLIQIKQPFVQQFNSRRNYLQLPYIQKLNAKEIL